MPKKVSEITSGQSNERSSDGGALADTSVRTWRVILNSPTETYNIQQQIDVFIGDPHPVNTGVPCVSISEKAEGDSRVVRIVTATYRTTPGSDPQGNSTDPRLEPPDVRPFQWSVVCQLMEIPHTEDALDIDGPDGDSGQSLVGLGAAVNPNGDLFEGMTKLVPIVNIRGEKLLENLPVGDLDKVGHINNEAFNFFGWFIDKHACLFRSLDCQPIVEPGTRNNPQPWRGYRCVYEFAVKTIGADATWNVRIPLAGFNIKNDRLGAADVDTGALSLELTDGGRIKNWPANPAYAVGTQGRKMRANILINHPEGGASQRPSAQPVALNNDGTPRKIDDNHEVIIKEFRVQEAMNFRDDFAAFGL
jgi:hypothetical protein